MRNFLKYTLATITGIIITSILLLITMIASLSALVASGDKPASVSDNSILVLKAGAVIPDRGNQDPLAGFDILNMTFSPAPGLNEILQNVVRSTEDTSPSLFAEIRDVERVLIVPVTSDRGLCGAFNSNVIKKTLSLIEEEYESVHNSGQLYVLPIGQKGLEYFKKRGYKVIEEYSQLFSHLSFDNVKEAADSAMDSFLNNELDKVLLVYNEFKNVATQILCVEQFLPLAGDR